MKALRTFQLFLLVISSGFLNLSFAIGQSSANNAAYTDSLKSIVEAAPSDTAVVAALQNWDLAVQKAYPDSGLAIKALMKEIVDRNLERDNLSETESSFYHNKLGYIYDRYAVYRYNRGDLDNSLKLHEKSLAAYGKGENDRRFSDALNNTANTLSDQGNYSKALEYYNRALTLKQANGDLKGEGNVVGNIAIIYAEIGELEKSLSYFRQAYVLKQKAKNGPSIASSINNIGSLYEMMDELDSAMFYFESALQMRIDSGYTRRLGTSYMNIATVYRKQGDIEEAVTNYNRALAHAEKVGDAQSKASALRKLGVLYADEKDHKAAINFFKKALEIAKQKGHAKLNIGAREGLVKSYKAIGAYRKAFETHKLLIALEDSMQEVSNDKKILRQEFKYEYERKLAADSAKTAEEAKVQQALLEAEQSKSRQNELEADQQRLFKYFLYGGLLIALLFGLFVFSRFRKSQQQNKVIEEQKKQVDLAYDQLEVKNMEILDSINYAQRIQYAILPPQKVVKEYLNKSFIFYQPKDIVSGDFYWMQTVDNGVLFAACDCTGHGVPGALVSVVCNNGLNRAVREFGLTSPGGVLDKTRELIIQEFEKSEEEVKDGMDIALCHLNGNKLEYAGAHNPLWIVRKGAEEVEEIKANKQPIGKFDQLNPYTTHQIELNEGDTLYLFSDGFVDQFGGEKGKKYKSANFRRFLVSIQDQDMEAQKSSIQNEFEGWKGDIEQLDDVCVIGVRI